MISSNISWKLMFSLGIYLYIFFYWLLKFAQTNWKTSARQLRQVKQQIKKYPLCESYIRNHNDKSRISL